jgi:hypothetical protein
MCHKTIKIYVISILKHMTKLNDDSKDLIISKGSSQFQLFYFSLIFKCNILPLDWIRLD